jgi:2-keto-4-pentenoate hydratase
MKNLFLLLIIACLTSCTSPKKKKTDTTNNSSIGMISNERIVDSILMARHNHVQTAILSTDLPDLKKSEAYDIQLAMLEKELKAGAKQIGWKLGGTATDDAAKFDPSYGYILNSNIVEEGGTIPVSHFPGGSVVVEAEVGFVMKNDLVKEVTSMKELINNIDYVVGGIEIAQATAISPNETPLDLNYVIASGMGHVAAIKGNVEVAAEDFDFENESAKCFINDKLVAEGISSNIYGSPLNALYHIANRLLEKDQHIKAGDLIITGSIFINPVLNEKANVRVEFSTLGTLTFKSE